MYKLTIIRLTENKTYEEDMKAYNEASRYGRSSMENYPLKLVEVQVLETTLEDAEFQAVKKACVEAIK